MDFPPEQDLTGAFSSAIGPDGARFAPGTLLLGRFRVIRLLGTGGMGEVYEAEDLELRERVAVKTIRLTHARDSSMVDRLRKEVQLGRRVSHPHVCRLFDVFRVTLPPTPGGPSVDCAIVTMELLRGRTLAEHIRDEGPIPLEQALPIARQIGEGLQAAHEAGVVHRDLKSANVFLAREGDSVRAVITDFGLATTVAGSGPQWELSVTGAVIGTLAYMSPEQLRGEPATPLSDIYAFGIVLYEMVSGVLPFRALTPMAAALKRVNERPEDLRRHLPDAPRPWHDAIHRCLATEPSKRFARASDVALALTHAPAWTTRPVVRWTATAATVIAIVAGSAYYVRLLKETTVSTSTSPGPAATAGARRSVALFGFENVTNRDEFKYISTALDQGLGSQLAADRDLRVVSGEEVARIKQELGLSPGATLAPDTLRRVRASLGADLIVLGSYIAVEGSRQLQVFFSVQDTSTGETVASWSQQGSEATLIDLIAESGAAARQELGLGSRDTGLQLASAKLALPSSGEARRLYAEGLDALRGFDASLAKTRFEQTIAEESGFALGHVGLSMAYGVLGYDAQAVREAAEAVRLAKGLRPEQQLWIEGLHQEATRDWAKAIATYTRLVKEYPDEPEYVIRLAEAQTSGGTAGAALSTIAAVRRAGAAFADDPRLWLAEASAAEALGDAPHQERAAHEAIAQAEKRGAQQIVGRASIALGRALQLLDKPGAREANERARRIAEAARDQRGVARALIQLGDLARQSGDIQTAERHLQTALSIAEGIGNQRQTMQALNELANVLFDSGRFAPAAEMYREAARVSLEVGDQNARARALGNLASVQYELGNVVEAQRLDDQALAIHRELKDRRATAFALSNMGETAADLGHLDRARELYEESRALTTELADKGELSYALSGLAVVARHRDDLEEAQRLLEEAMRLRHDVSDREGEAQARVDLARVVWERGDGARAQRLLAELPATLGPDTTALAGALRARLALRAKDVRGARQALTLPRGQAAPNYGLVPRMLLDLAEARVLAAEGKRAEAVSRAEGVRERMRSRQLQALELEAALAVVEITADKAAAARLASRAEAAGFRLVARKAHALRQ